MRVIKGNNFAELYKNTCSELINNPEYVTSPRGQKIKEITNAVLINNDPTSNLFLNNTRNVPLKYLAGELLWYFSARNDLDFISKFSSFWKNIANDDGTCNSAYGNLLFAKTDAANKNSQWRWAYDSLVNDKDTRQAIIHFNRPEHQYNNNRDFVCTLVGNFQIRDNKLNFTIDMRSNDIFFGLTFDYPFFTLLQQQMLRHLKQTYHDLELGTYIHTVHSLHVYERNFKQIENMLNNEFKQYSTPELDIDLIDINGNANKDLINLVDYIQGNKSEFVQISDSNLIKWLYLHAVDKS